MRPSAFSEDAGPDALTLPIVLSEYIGAQSVLMSALGGQNIQIEVSTAAPIPAGQSRSFRIDERELHLFDPKSEAAL
ncbi:MAG: hypothetical protein ACE360_01250 [Hyphomicrobiales bacterium]